MLGNLSHMNHNPQNRGYHAIYRANERNHCPGCGRSHWHIGRSTAECGFCATALPLTEMAQQTAAPSILRMGKGGGKVS